jgi:uncharacterized lipoprotein YmbA
MSCRGLRLLAIWIPLAAGCSHSPSTEFFTLHSIAPETSMRAAAGTPVRVSAVHIPAMLDRPQLVAERSDDRLDIREEQRWGAPLDEMARRVLSENLAARLPGGMVLDADSPAAADARNIVIDIREFEPDPRNRIILDGSWTVVGSDAQRTPAMHNVHIETAAGTDSQANAMSRALGKLADDIVAGLAH